MPILLAVALSACAGGCAREPDVLVLFVDTLRHDRLGCSDARGVLPALEQYTLEGACFERVASTAGWTLPTETSMLVSAYPEEHGVQQRHSEVDVAMIPITSPLGREGYASALFSGNVLTSHPQYQPYFEQLWVIDKSQEFAADVDTQVVDEALAWIEHEAHGSPLFLVLQLYGAHYPYCPPGTGEVRIEVPGLHDGVIDLCDPNHADLLRAAETIDPFPDELAAGVEAAYDREVEYTGAEIERFLARWDEHRTRPRISVVVTDHGEAFGEHGNFLHGRSLYWETSDAHMAFHGDAIERVVVDRPVELLDLAPTLTGLLGLQPDPAWRGVDLAPLLADPAAQFTARAYQVSTLLEAAQYSVTAEGDDGHRYRLLAWEETAARELYDATVDPLEELDLYDDPAAAHVQPRLEVLLDDMVATAADGGPPRGG